MKLESVLDRKLISITNVVRAVDPAKLYPVPVGDQDVAGSQIVGRQLSDNPVLDLQAPILNRMQVFVAGAKNKMVLIFGVYVLSMRLRDRSHAAVQQKSGPPSLKREIH